MKLAATTYRAAAAVANLPAPELADSAFLKALGTPH